MLYGGQNTLNYTKIDEREGDLEDINESYELTSQGVQIVFHSDFSKKPNARSSKRKQTEDAQTRFGTRTRVGKTLGTTKFINLCLMKACFIFILSIYSSC